jgi:multiple sugar transport system substrate-binding protein
LLFVASVWLGLREPARPPARVTTPEVPARIGETPQPAATAEPTGATIIFACDDVGAVYRDYARIARAFEQENPDIEVTVKSFRDLIGNPSLSYTEYMQEVAANADAFCAWDVAPLVEAHLLYDLEALAARDASFESGDFYAAVLDSVRDDGALYAVPGRFQPALIRYNPQVFDEVGLAYPQPGWTWNDFATAARALTVRDGSNTQRWGYGEDRSAVFVARLAEAFSDPAFAAAARSDDPLADEAVFELFRWYEGLYVNDRSAFPPRGGSGEYSGYTPGDVYQGQILRGKLAMWTDQLYEGARRQGKPAPFPANGPSGGAPIYMGAAWAIAAETLHPDAAWRWLTYLSRNPPPDSRQMLPARKSLVEKAAFWKDLPSDEAAVYRYVLDHLASRPHFLREAEALALYEQLGRLARGEVSAAELRERRRPQPATATMSVTEGITITFAAPREHIAAYRRAAEAFREQGGTARVQVVAHEDFVDTGRAETTNLWSQMRQITRRVDALAGPEVAALVRSGRAESSLYDLTELAQSLAREEFYPNMLESLQWGGRQWALPDRVSPYVIYYNQWMFDQMGVPHPQPGWRWEDFTRTARAVTRQGEDKIKWWGVRDGLQNQLLILVSAAGPLVDYTVTPPRPLLDSPVIVDAAQRYSDLIRRGHLTAPGALVSGAGSQTGQLYGLEAPDDAAMWIGLADLSKLDDLQRSGIGAVQLPISNPVGDTPIEIQNALAMSATSPHPEAAWEWLRFLLDYGTADSRGAGAPARRTILLDGASSVAPASLGVYQTALLRAQRAAPLRTEEYHAQRALWAAIARLAQGDGDAPAVMREAQAAAEAAIGR